jgi:hypothetical protein
VSSTSARASFTRQHSELLALVALTALALAVRIPLMDQSLTLDEPHAWVIAEGSLGDLFRELRAGYEIHPPLYFMLAWLAGKFGDPVVWVRMPSLVLGTASVPLTYLLGRLTVGRTAAAAGAALLALSPFAVHYSTDARPYATLMFFCLASTLALLMAVDTRRAGWWVLYAVSACAVLYTHYFGAFVLLAQAGWTIWVARDQGRAVLLSYIGIAVGYLPWVPSLLDQPHTTSDYAGLVPLSLDWLGDQLVMFFPGDGFNLAGALPGSAALVVTGVTIAVLLGAVARRSWPPSSGTPSRGLILLVLIVLATPIGLLLFSAPGDNVALARYLGPTLPAFLLLLSALLVRVPRPLGVAAFLSLLVVLGVGTAKSYETRFARTDYKGAARYLEDSVRPGDQVLELALPADSRNRLGVSPIDLNFKRELPVITVPQTEFARRFQEAPPEGRIFVAGTDYGAFLQLPRPAPEDGLCAVRRVEFNGFVAVFAYERAVTYKGGAPGGGQARLADGGRVLRLASGTTVPVAPGSVRGRVDRIERTGPSAQVTGWAVDSGAHPAGCLLVFAGDRLVGFGLPSSLRPDLSERFGRSAEGAGFSLQTAPGVRPASLRVFAVADGKAAELEGGTGP